MQDVFSEIKSFAQGQVFSDDVCFVGMEITRLEAGLMRFPGQGRNSFEPGIEAAMA